MFPEHAYSRVACAGVPLLLTLVIALVGSGVIRDDAIVAAASMRVHLQYHRISPACREAGGDMS